MSFANDLKNSTSIGYTDNGSVCLTTSGQYLVDLYATIGGMRTADLRTKTKAFDLAVGEDKLLAAKILAYGRDVREGLGERDTFRQLIKYAADKYPEMVLPNLNLIGYYGRFDDMYALIGTKCEDAMWEAMGKQFKMDLENMAANKPCSLLAKWIKTPDASSKETRRLGILTSQKLGYKTVGAFKKDLRALRKYLDIVEIKVSANSIDTIAYEAVPSNAMKKYRNIFKTKDADRFAKYLESVAKGEVKINANTLYPYDIVKKYIKDSRFGNAKADNVLEAQWKALPNYVEDGTNILIMADVSGSMTFPDYTPMATSVGLALYFAERAKGDFHNMFMTFSARPKLVTVGGVDVASKINNIMSSDCGMNTDLDQAMSVILETAVKNHTPAEDLPKALVIISDMQIDYCCRRRDNLFYEYWRDEFAKAGYEIPNIVFWNVNSTESFHANSNIRGVQLASGLSVTVFKAVLNGIGMTAFEAMMDVLNRERYDKITVNE